MNGLVHVEDVMGTAVVLDLRWRAGHEPDGVEDALVDAVQVLHDVDLVFSTWRPDSPVSRLRRAETGLQSCPPEVREVVLLCVRAMRLSAGWFDPWRQPGGFDPTGLVKGWAAKRAAARLSAAGITDHCVNAGGDVCVTGSGEPDEPDSWTVGITDPEEPSRLLTVVTVRGGGVATSGGYERGPLAVDPFTGVPVERLLSATVVGPELAIADALATAATAAGPDARDWLEAAPGYEALLVVPGGGVLVTSGWPGPTAGLPLERQLVSAR